MSLRMMAAAAVLAALAIPGHAQAPAFEVASVKRNLSGAVGSRIQVPPAGTITFTNVALRILIRDAYQVDAYTERYRLIAGPFARIIGTAGVSGSDVPRFDVQGKPPDNTPGPERRAMMRTLLEDRFTLRVHREMREMPVYALTVAREGRLGPNMAPSKFDCRAWLTQRRFGGTAEEPVDASGRSWCLNFVDTSRAGVTHERFAGPVSVLMQRMQAYAERPIIDATGLSANFEWVLTVGWGPNAPADVPTVFTALQDQLGLKLEPRRAPVEVLVVDHVELPTPD
jgi:uncharacterized protein (TIGR03435 family)